MIQQEPYSMVLDDQVEELVQACRETERDITLRLVRDWGRGTLRVRDLESLTKFLDTLS